MAASYHHSQFTALQLLRIKQERQLTIGLAIPTYNEGQYLEEILKVLKAELIDDVKLVDDIAIVDSGSTDDTLRIANCHEVRVLDGLAGINGLPSIRGKGENLWKSLFYVRGDILVWIDADIQKFHSGFVTGLLGPLLTNPAIQYSTAFYQRPCGNDPTGGGRVTELLVRPFLSMFLGEMAIIRQPMAGEHAGYRSLLEQLPFFTGYAVDVGLLIDIISRLGDGVIAEVDCGIRFHRNRTVRSLGSQAFCVYHSLVTRARQLGRIASTQISTEFIHLSEGGHYGNLRNEALQEPERPAATSIAYYHQRDGCIQMETGDGA